ncbi:choice-of-anchor A family protein [Hyalangium versicolor]|uniref:choice-of-anchor A family protein n=1 Tax=Hyalangium versicolor TaxID=2861190 RepID=UPI001CD02E26|nr:choice-of-anchor A family protein [Hyalangium versicolor]
MKRQAGSWWLLFAVTASACGAQELTVSETREPPAAPENSETRSQLACINDQTPPLSRVSFEKVANGGVEVWIHGEDSCSGVRKVNYKISGPAGEIATSGSNWVQLFFSVPETSTITYSAEDYFGNIEQPHTLTVTPPGAYCMPALLRDATLFLRGNYSGGHFIGGNVKAANIALSDFSVGSELPADTIADALWASTTLNIQSGAVYGNAYYGTSTTANTTTTFYNGGALVHGQPNVENRYYGVSNLSQQLSRLSANGTTRLEPWGGVFLEGTDPRLNVFTVDPAAFGNAVYRSISVPQGAVAVVNFSAAASLTLAGGGINLSGLDPTSVLYNFPSLGTLDIHGIQVQGTILAPNTTVSFNNASLQGAIYATHLSGNGESHVARLREFQFCQVLTP